MPTSRRRGSILPIVVGIALVLGGVVAARAAGNGPDLPAISPDRLVASMLRSIRVHPAVSGGVEGPAEYGDPLTVARHLLAAVNASTSVRVEGAVRVAGRDADLLVVRPRTAQTLVGRIDIAVDAEHRLPLSVTVTPRSSGRAALYVRYTSVDFGPIDPAVYHFTPPAGARVQTPSPDAAPVAPSLGLVGALGEARTFRA